MTAPTDYAPTDTAPAGIWRTEFADTVKLALPLALTQLGQIAMMTCDLLLIGRLGDQAVAAASLNFVWRILYVCSAFSMASSSNAGPQ